MSDLFLSKRASSPSAVSISTEKLAWDWVVAYQNLRDVASFCVATDSALFSLEASLHRSGEKPATLSGLKRGRPHWKHRGYHSGRSTCEGGEGMRFSGVLATLAFGAAAFAGGSPPLLSTLFDPELVDLAFVDEGRLVLVASGEGLELWDAQEGRRIALRPIPHIRDIATNAARTLVAVGLDYGLEVLELPMLAPVQFLFHPRLASPTRVALSPSGRTVAGDFGIALAVWRTYSGDLVAFVQREELKEDVFSIDAIEFLSEEELVIAADARVFVWDFMVGKTREIGRAFMRFYHLVVDPRQRLVGFPADNAFVVVQVDTGQEICRLPLHAGSHFWGEFSPQGNLVLPGQSVKGIGLHLFPRGTSSPSCCYGCRWDSPLDPAQKAALSRNGSRLALVEALDPFVRQVVIYEVENCQRVGRFGRWGASTVVVRVTEDGVWLVRATSEGLEVWQTTTGLRVRALAEAAPVDLALARRAPVAAAVASYGARVVVWNWETNRQTSLKFEDERALRLALSPDGAQLVVVHRSGTVSLWSVQEGRELWRFEGENPNGHPVISQDGRLLLTVGRKGVRVRDLATGSLLGEHPAEIYASEVHLVREGLLMVQGIVGRAWQGRPAEWHRVAFAPSGKIIEFTALQAPGGPGAFIPPQTLVVWERDWTRTEHRQADLWLWDIERDQPLHRWTLQWSPALWRSPYGFVVALPGTREVLVGTAGSVLRRYSVNLPPRNLAIRAPTWAMVGDPLQICATAEDPEGGPLAYFWDLGEGALAEGACVRRAFPVEGEYTLRVMVRDDAGGFLTAEHKIRAVSLLARAGIWPARPGVLEEVTFQDVSVPPEKVVRVLWDFGDGTQGEGRTVRHRYTAPGRYTVRVAVHFVGNIVQHVELPVEVEDVSCVEIVPAPGAAQFYRVRLAPADRNRLRFGDTVWIVRRVREADEDKWVMIARAAVLMLQTDGAWVVLADPRPAALPQVGDRVFLREP